MARVYHASMQLCFNGGVFQVVGGGGGKVDISVDINWLPIGIGGHLSGEASSPNPLAARRHRPPPTPHPPQEPVLRCLGEASRRGQVRE